MLRVAEVRKRHKRSRRMALNDHTPKSSPCRPPQRLATAFRTSGTNTPYLPAPYSHHRATARCSSTIRHDPGTRCSDRLALWLHTACRTQTTGVAAFRTAPAESLFLSYLCESYSVSDWPEKFAAVISNSRRTTFGPNDALISYRTEQIRDRFFIPVGLTLRPKASE
jgi:hypothetical protein